MQTHSFWNSHPHTQASSKERWYFALSTFCLFTVFFLFVHVREVKVAILELGTLAPKYIVTEVPFSFADEEATLVARQEALLDVGKVYAVDTEDVLKRSVEFENSLIYDQSWRAVAPQTTFDEMCRANDRLEKTLKEIRFSDPRTIEKMRQLSLDTSLFLEIVPFDVHQGMYFPEKIWEFLRKWAFFDQSFNTSTIEYIMSFYKEKIWSLKDDNQTVRKIRSIIQEQIPRRYTNVPAGSKILNAGERVTTRHIAMLLAMKQALSEGRNLWHFRTILGSLAFSAVIIATFLFFLRKYQPDILRSSAKYGLLVTVCIIAFLSAKLCEFFLLRSTHALSDAVHYPLLTPFVGILLSVLLSDMCAIFITTFFAIIFDTCLAFDFEGFLLANVIVSYAVIIATKGLSRRAEIVSICFRGWCAAVCLIFALYLYDRVQWGGALLADIGGAGIFMVMTAILVVGLLPFFEVSFNVLTDMNLMEYMDPNNEILRRLMVEAPGTYQHVIIMGGLAEAAAQAIDCNGLFCRVASLYHDIGKIPIAQYFTENQQTGENIHQHLTPQESAKVITSHIPEGVEMAKQAGLPEAFIDVIQEHHGTGMVYYFYRKLLEQQHGPLSDEDAELFRYKGPLPHSKESGIIMIADAFEAGSRSIDELNQERLSELIDRIVREKIDDGQLDECQLTLEELNIIKLTMVRSLLSIGHVRVKYPVRPRSHSQDAKEVMVTE